MPLNYCPWDPSFSVDTRNNQLLFSVFDNIDLVSFPSPFQLLHVFVSVNSSYPLSVTQSSRLRSPCLFPGLLANIIKELDSTRPSFTISHSSTFRHYITQRPSKSQTPHPTFNIPQLLGIASLHKAFHLSTCPMTRKRHMRAVSKVFS